MKKIFNLLNLPWAVVIAAIILGVFLLLSSVILSERIQEVANSISESINVGKTNHY